MCSEPKRVSLSRIAINQWTNPIDDDTDCDNDNANNHPLVSHLCDDLTTSRCVAFTRR